jgi:hypothetical protein
MFDKFLILFTATISVANSIIMIEYRQSITGIVPPAYWLNACFCAIFFITSFFMLKKAWKYRVRSPIWKRL